MLQNSGAKRHSLVSHPTTPSGLGRDAIEEISVTVSRPSSDRLELVFNLIGSLESLRFPEPRQPVRADGLWRHSCFEAFIGRAGGTDYWEYNFSPSGAWATYHFTDYREAMSPLLTGAPPIIRQQIGSETFDLTALLDLSWLSRSPPSQGLKLGLSAVIEDKARVLSYWALKHPAEKPDFHHAEGFVIELD